MSIDTADYGYLQELIYKHTGIVVDNNKEYLLEARLLPLASDEGVKSITELVAKLRVPGFFNSAMQLKVVEAMTTNETTFFRDLHPFEALKNTVLPTMMKTRAHTRTINIWCAASSSGQEPYSIAMTIREHFPELLNWKINILATDLSPAMLVQTSEGRYNQLEVNRGLPALMLTKYFMKDGDQWQIRGDLREMIKTDQLNLIGSWPVLPAMDIIFIRNVLIYFDNDTKRIILRKMREIMQPDGYLFLGGAETTLNLDNAYERVEFSKTGCYQLRAEYQEKAKQVVNSP